MSAAIEYLAVRIPSTLKRQIEAEAYQTNKSLNTVVREILEARYYPGETEPIGPPFEPRTRRSDAPTGHTTIT
jgi:hypothetical protein